MATSIKRISNTSTTILPGSTSGLVVSKNMTRNFGAPEDFVELHVTDPTGRNIYSVVPFTNYRVPGTLQPTGQANIQELEFDPQTDLTNLGVLYGDYILTYNVLRPKIYTGYTPTFILKEISGDRTEIRLITNSYPNDVVESSTLNFIYEFQNEPYFKEFYINFGKNNLLAAINIALDTNTNPYSILIKLLNPLPLQFDINTLVSIVDEISNAQSFEIVVTPDTIPVTFPTLRGPNFDLDLDNLRVGPTPYYNFDQVTHFNGQFAPQLQQLLSQLSASNFSINIDYTNYEDFVHFSSATRRLEGFKYKLDNIEYYTSASASAALSSNVNSQLDATSYQTKINKFVQSFDGWEQYMFYESSSYAWPKTNTDKPYINASTASLLGNTWYNGTHDSASLYDDNNQNYLLYTLPSYINENEDNELAFKFVASIGQMFDDIWIHIKAISDLYQAKNSLTEGISKDIVYFALQSMGINVYTDQDGNNVFKYLYGVNPDGSYLPQTGSWETLISASNYQIPGQDLQKGIYKRIYHNLPLLLKSKGTNRFIQYLNTIFGIPDTIMSYTEYGGVDKVTSSFEYEYDRFTYGLNMNSDPNTFASPMMQVPLLYSIQSFNRTGDPYVMPDAIELRIKPYVTASSYMISTIPTQSVFYLLNSSWGTFNLDLIYTQTGSSDSIYSGSVGDFGYFQIKADSSAGGSLITTSSTIPIFTTGSNNETSWYNILLQRRIPNRSSADIGDNQYYDLYVKNNIWGEIGHVTSASLNIDGTTNSVYNRIWYEDSGGNLFRIGGITNPLSLSGSVQELRIWSNYISESTFNSHVLNPESIEGNYTSSAYDDLYARFALGNDLYTYDHNIVTDIASVAPDQTIQSFTASFIGFPNENNYSSFTEWYYADVANSGLSNPVTDKIRIYSGSEYGTQLLPHQSIEIPPIIPVTKDIHLLDAGLSPQDEINRDIIAHFGSTYDLDNIIGNSDTGSYQQFQLLQQEYFKKYINKYNYKDYIRLIEFFHSSLFRTLKDFTPARTDLSTGIIIKPHLLERPRVLRPEPFVTDPNNFFSTINTAFLTASNGGNYSQSLYNKSYTVPNGIVSLLSDGRDFFDGELPSSSINYHSVFKSLNKNPYTKFNPDFYDNLYLTTISSAYPYSYYYSGSIWKYSYNVLKNNVSGSTTSTYRQRLQAINDSNGNLINVKEPIQLQDFTYNYYRHILPRYKGSKSTTLNYNFYNRNDSLFSNIHQGPFGKNATIDKNSVKFAYFNQAVATGVQLLAARERTNLYLKYLIDDSGSLSELTLRNYDTIKNSEFWNLYQVQNNFKQGEILNISLFDNTTPTNQKSLDGNKTIFDSGYKYHPVLWKQFNNQTLRFVSTQAQVTDPSISNVNNWVLRGPWGHGNWFDWQVHFNNPNNIVLPFKLDVVVSIHYTTADRPCWLCSWRNHEYWDQRYTTQVVPIDTNNMPNYNGYGSTGTADGWDCGNLWGNVVSVRQAQGVDPNAIFDIDDTHAYLIVDPVDKRYISCSIVLTPHINDPTEEVYFSGSLFTGTVPLPGYNTFNYYTSSLPPEYPISIYPGDLWRFDSGSDYIPNPNPGTLYFKPANEYTVIETKPLTNDAYFVFKLDRPVDSSLTGSATFNGVTYSIIDRYILSRKITDETNIVINFQKNIGATSGGIIKNSNLLPSIDNKVADIVGDLKSRIFSTVLVP